MEGRRVGRYALVKLIGRGGMADVWVGKAFGASGFEKIVAIKLLAPYNVDKEDYQRALTDEARVLVQLKHPNIVDVYDLNFEAENPYLVMEFVEGTELRDILRALRAKNETLPFSLANYVLYETSKALSHAHERRDLQSGLPLKIVHRDVSPSNILVSSQGDVKLSDFGIAKSVLQSAHTQVGLIKGKFRYMSPEQAEGETLDGRSDMFSLGLVYYECLFGAPAYDGASDVGILQMARAGNVKVPESCPAAVRSLLLRLTAPDPNDRFPDLAAVRRLFAEEAKRLGGLADRDELARYLESLDLPQLRKAGEARREAEYWDPQPTSQILTEHGTIETLADQPAKKSRKWLYTSLAGCLVGAVALTAFVMGERGGLKAVSVPETVPIAAVVPSPPRDVAVPSALQPAPRTSGALVVETTPEDATVLVKYGDQTKTQAAPLTLKDLPFDVPVAITASKKGFRSGTRELTLTAESPEEKLNLALTRIDDVNVRFVADPYAEVTVPGHVAGIETPIASRRFPPGNYDVIFYHAPSGHKAVARLKGQNGGSFLCSARMAVTNPSAKATAFCRPR